MTIPVGGDSTGTDREGTLSGTTITAYQNPEIEQLQSLIEAARARLAELETTYTKDRLAVDNVKARIFSLVVDHYIARDRAALIVLYRRKYLDTLLRSGEEGAEEILDEYQDARADTEANYEDAAAAADSVSELSEDEQAELQGLWKKLVMIFHPDRHASDPDKKQVYDELTAVINRARDDGDIALLREIANDPAGFIQKQGWRALDLAEGVDLKGLKSLYDTLQVEILELIELLEQLHQSEDYELAVLSETSPTVLDEIAEEQKSTLSKEITDLEREAAELQEEIDNLIGPGETAIL